LPSLTVLVAASVSTVFLLPALAFAGLTGNGQCSTAPTAVASESAGAAASPKAGGASLARWEPDQRQNAAAIVNTGIGLGVPPRGWVIAVAVAIQESSLRNVNYGDQAGPDSRGLFQQRTDWGPLSTRMNAHKAASLFFTGGLQGQPGLLDISGWQQMPFSEAANAVQHSAHPGAYAEHEADAVTLVTAVGSGLSQAIPEDLEQFVSNPDCVDAGGDGLPASASEALPAGFSLPKKTAPAVRATIIWALKQLGTPYSYGGDCIAAHSGNPVHQCDCSSLTQMAYRTGGIALPRTTIMQVRAGSPVYDVSDVRPGDLIFIPGTQGTLTSPRHVGMYLGEGLIVQAPKTGDNVKLSRLSDWASISAIRRIVEP
jgi:cell wall-associated NlpC family hydrolase